MDDITVSIAKLLPTSLHTSIVVPEKIQWNTLISSFGHIENAAEKAKWLVDRVGTAPVAKSYLKVEKAKYSYSVQLYVMYEKF